MDAIFGQERRKLTAKTKVLIFATVLWMLTPGASPWAQQARGGSPGPMLHAETHVVAESPDPGRLFVYEPALVKLPGGRLLATFEHTLIDANARVPRRFRLAVSEDEGRTWRQHPPLDLHSAQPFVHEGTLYLLGNLAIRRNIVILRSNDEGRSWTGPVTLFEGSYWNAPTGVLVKDGRLYRSFNLHENADGTPNLRNYQGCVVIAGDLSQDLLRQALVVDVRGVEEVDAPLEAQVHHRRGGIDIGLRPERHRAHAGAGHLEVGMGEFSSLHDL